MHRVLSRDQIRSFDRIAIETCHVPGVVLMENAGRGAFEVIRSLLDDVDHVLVVCGSGNNGGDGFVVARHLLSSGVSVTVCLLSDPAKLRGDALLNHDAFVGLGGEVTLVEDEPGLLVLETELMRAGLVVDAMFGTGLDREIEGRYAEVIDRINATPATRVALDLPSGLDANTGTVLGTVVVADVTITFGALKLGLLTPMGARLAGEVHVASLGVPSSILEQTGHEAEVLVGARIRDMVQRIRAQAGILQDGAVGIVVSSEEEAWALRLAMLGALRTAPCRVKLIAPSRVLWGVRDLASNARLEELEPKDGAKTFERAVEDCDSIVFPSASEADLPWLKQARKSFDGSIVVRPSHSLGKKSKQLRSKGGDTVMVVGLEELGALFDADGESVDADRFGSVRSAMKACDAAVVLADTQPVIGIPGTSLGILGKRVEALDADGVRVVACGVMGRMACWSEASVAALAGLHVTSAAVEAWLDQRKGRGGPLAEEIAEGIPGVM
jgi:NAD(P)H-hydrate epimerase